MMMGCMLMIHFLVSVAKSSQLNALLLYFTDLRFRAVVSEVVG